MEIPDTDQAMPLRSHLSELKKRLLACCAVFFISFIFSYFFSDKILYFITKPLLSFTDNRMIYTSIVEPFFVYINISLSAALGISIPFFVIQAYLFAAPGLHRQEKKWALIIGVSSVVMFAVGVALMYYIILPIAVDFLMKFNTSANFAMVMQPKIGEYIGLFFQLAIGFGMAFEIPVLLVILAKIGIISHVHLQKFRRFAIVIIFIIAAIVTPPDVLSQIILASVMILFYEITILICKLIRK